MGFFFARKKGHTLGYSVYRRIISVFDNNIPECSESIASAQK